jgi:predicted CopG family antitoxin
MIRTTIQLREDIYQALKRKFGKRKLSVCINEILAKELLKPGKSLFGTMKKVDLTDLRDRKDRI